MKWNCAIACGAMALGWLAAAARALDPPTASRSAPVVPAAIAGEQIQPPGKEVALAGEPQPACPCEGISWPMCCGECGRWHWQAGAGLYLLQPFFDKDPAFTTSIYQGTGAYDPGGKGLTTSTQTTTTTTTSSTGTQNTTSQTGGAIDHDGWPPGHDKHHHWEDEFFRPPGRRKFPPWTNCPPASNQSTSTSSTSQTTTTTTTTQNSTADPKPGGGAGGAGLASRQDFGHDLEVSPLIWIGVVNNDGLGFRTRWWQLRESSGTLVVNGDATGSTEITSASPLGLSISSPSRTLEDGVGADVWLFHRELKLAVWDVEATQSFDVGSWTLLVTGGARLAHIAQNYSALRSNGGPDPAAGVLVQQDASALWSGHSFNGAGPMASLEARRPIADSGLVLYGNARGSILFGTRKQTASTEEVYVGTLADNTPFNLRTSDVATARGDAVLPVVECEVGVEYGRPVGRFYPFVRAGLVSQVWFNAGNSSSTDGTFGFLGLEAALGVNF